MTTNQPDWECVDQLGDATPLDFGGYWVLRDKTGVYCEEGELLEVDDENVDVEDTTYEVRRFILERCTYIDGVLSDNEFHPEHAAWFATPERERAERPQDNTYLSNIASYCGTSVEDLIKMFCSKDPLQRAHAYREVGMYHGFDNLDEYPLKLNRQEAEARYADHKFQVVKANAPEA